MHTADCLAEGSPCRVNAESDACENWIEYTLCDPWELSIFDGTYQLAMAEITDWAIGYIQTDTTTCTVN